MLALKVKTWSGDTSKATEHTSRDGVTVEVTSEELAKRHNPTIIDLDIYAKDGSRSRFFISARVKNGRPVVEVSVNRLNCTATRKSVTGSFGQPKTH